MYHWTGFFDACSCMWSSTSTREGSLGFNVGFLADVPCEGYQEAQENGPVGKNCTVHIKEGLRPSVHSECKEYPRIAKVLPLICRFEAGVALVVGLWDVESGWLTTAIMS